MSSSIPVNLCAYGRGHVFLRQARTTAQGRVHSGKAVVRTWRWRGHWTENRRLQEQVLEVLGRRLYGLSQANIVAESLLSSSVPRLPAITTPREGETEPAWSRAGSL